VYQAAVLADLPNAHQPRKERRMNAAIRVQVYATDPILHAGAVASLSAAHDLVVLSAGSPDRSAVDVAVIVSDSLDEHTSATLARLHRLTGPRVVLVMDAVDGRAVLAAVEAGTGALVRRSEASGERLAQAVRRVAVLHRTVRETRLDAHHKLALQVSAVNVVWSVGARVTWNYHHALKIWRKLSLRKKLAV